MNLLVAVESPAAGSLPDSERIDSLPKAVWYSLVTLSTVGYGDLYPHTAAGRVIGVLFLLLSTGLLALLIGLVVSSITGRALPELILWWNRRKPWYIFSSDNDASRVLAANFQEGVVVFCGKSVSRTGISIYRTPLELFSMRFSEDGERFLFAMDEDSLENEKIAMELYSRRIQIYCRSDGLDEKLPVNVTQFSEYECCARLYWQSRPWDILGEHVVMVGSDQYAQSLAIQGLLSAPPGCTLGLLGDWDEWLSIHRVLAENNDLPVRLSFYGKEWYSQEECLRDAGRLILCADRMEDNRRIQLKLQQYYAIPGKIDVLSTPAFQDVYYFGSAETLFTPELVMKQILNRRAKQLHELYRSKASYPVPEWEELPSFVKLSNLAAADHILTKLRILIPEMDIRDVNREACAMASSRYKALSDVERERFRLIEHERWMLFYMIYNWKYAMVRDNARREHPLMVRYDMLSESEREKDDNAWEQIAMLAAEE